MIPIMPIDGGTDTGIVSVSAFPGNLNFGNVPIGTSASLNVTLSSRDGRTFFGGCTFSDSQFSSPTPAQWIGTEAAISVNIVYTPNRTGAVSATVTLNNSTSDIDIGLTGNGTAVGPSISVQPILLVANNNVAINTVNFSGKWRIFNPSGSDLVINSITFTAPFQLNSYSGISGVFPVTIPSGSSFFLSVDFAPTTIGSFSVSNAVIISNNAGPDVLIGLSGSSATVLVGIDPTVATVPRWTTPTTHGTRTITAFPSSGTISWTCNGEAPGTGTDGLTISATGNVCTFTAPATGTGVAGIFDVRALSSVDGTTHSDCLVTVSELQVSINPETVSLHRQDSIQFTAILIGDATWTIDGAAPGSTGIGEQLVVDAGVATYTATANDTGTHVVRATSVLDPTIFSEAVITIITTGRTLNLNIDQWPLLKGLMWDVKLSPEFFGLEQKSWSPGYDTEISYGPDPVYHFKCSYSILRDNPGLNERRTIQSFFEARRGKFQSFLLYLPVLTQNLDDGFVQNQPLIVDQNGYAPLIVSRPTGSETIYEAGGINGNPGFPPVIKIQQPNPYSGYGVDPYGTSPYGAPTPTPVVIPKTNYRILGPGVALPNVTYPGLVIQFLTAVTGIVLVDLYWLYRVRFEQSLQEFNLFSYLMWEAQEVQLVSTRTQ